MVSIGVATLWCWYECSRLVYDLADLWNLLASVMSLPWLLVWMLTTMSKYSPLRLRWIPRRTLLIYRHMKLAFERLWLVKVPVLLRYRVASWATAEVDSLVLALRNRLNVVLKLLSDSLRRHSSGNILATRGDPCDYVGRTVEENCRCLLALVLIWWLPICGVAIAIVFVVASMLCLRRQLPWIISCWLRLLRRLVNRLTHVVILVVNVVVSTRWVLL